MVESDPRGLAYFDEHGALLHYDLTTHLYSVEPERFEVVEVIVAPRSM